MDLNLISLSLQLCEIRNPRPTHVNYVPQAPQSQGWNPLPLALELPCPPWLTASRGRVFCVTDLVLKTRKGGASCRQGPHACTGPGVTDAMNTVPLPQRKANSHRTLFTKFKTQKSRITKWPMLGRWSLLSSQMQLPCDVLCCCCCCF